MRNVKVEAGSFPQVITEALLDMQPQEQWQVLCGDSQHWRLGIYSPQASSLAELQEFERHSCPELFMLIEGKLSLAIIKSGMLQTIELKQNQPILVSAPHNGFCPQGPYTGKALVVERDQFETEYRSLQAWLEN